jgi:hypothetical protein
MDKHVLRALIDKWERQGDRPMQEDDERGMGFYQGMGRAAKDLKTLLEILED